MSLNLLTEEEVNDYDNNSHLSPEDIRKVQHPVLSLNEYACDDPIINKYSDGVF